MSLKLDNTRKTFKEAMLAWQGIQNIRFGPAETGMRHHNLQFWPDKKNHIGKRLNKLLASKNNSKLEDDGFP